MLVPNRALSIPLRVTADCVKTEKDFLQLEKDWNRLVMESARPSPFLTWEWVSTWWQYFGGNSTLFVIVMRDETDRVVGIAPLHLVMRRAFGVIPVRTVEFLGYRGSKVRADHLDFLTLVENRNTIVSLLLRKIFEKGDEWDSLVLADIAEESMVPDLLEQIQTESGTQSQCAPAERCPYISLPSRWETLLGSIKANYRNNVKRRRDKLSRDFRVHFDWDCSPRRVAPHLDLLANLHRSSRNRKGQTGNFHDKTYCEFHHAVAERMARSGYLYLARLDCNELPVAAFYGYHFGGRLFGYQTGFDANWAERGVGAVLQAMVFEDVIERLHDTEYDFLRGEEGYKYTWGARQRLTRTVWHWNNSFSARIASAEFATRRTVAVLRSRLPAHSAWFRTIK